MENFYVNEQQQQKKNKHVNFICTEHIETLPNFKRWITNQYNIKLAGYKMVNQDKSQRQKETTKESFLNIVFDINQDKKRASVR